MNMKLVALAFGKLTEACALFREAAEQSPNPGIVETVAASPAVTQASLNGTEPTPAATIAAATANGEVAEVGTKKARKSSAAKAAPKVEVVETVEEIQDEDEFADIEEAEAKVYTQEEVKKALVEYARANSKDKAYAILAKFNAKKTTDLAEKDFASVIKELKA